MLKVKFITTDSELLQVAELSKNNLGEILSKEVRRDEGFVSWKYPVETLRTLHMLSPSVIVKDGEIVVGYVIILTKAGAMYFEPLKEALKWFNGLRYQNRSVLDYRIYILGQACVASAYRGKGILQLLYNFQWENLGADYDFAVSEIVAENTRSYHAHKKLGFYAINSRLLDGVYWKTVMWKLQPIQPLSPVATNIELAD